jgi:hypothetical protein
MVFCRFSVNFITLQEGRHERESIEGTGNGPGCGDGLFALAGISVSAGAGEAANDKNQRVDE